MSTPQHHFTASDDAVDRHTMDPITGTPRTIERVGPDSDITVTAMTITTKDDGAVQLVQMRGFQPDFDYLNAAEARELARALIAAADDLVPELGKPVTARGALTAGAVILATLAPMLWFLMPGLAESVLGVLRQLGLLGR